MPNSVSFGLAEFEYVVYKPLPAKVCFGSTLERSTNPIGKYTSSFQKFYSVEENSLSPCSFSTENYKTISNTKNIPLPILVLETGERIKFRTGARSARFTESILRTPSPTRYEVGLEWNAEKKDNKYPFGSRKLDDRNTYSINSLPGPGTYELDTRKCRQMLKQHNFGKPVSEDIIEMICVPRPRHECSKCKLLCVGDYWHIDYNVFLCLVCWKEEKITAELYNSKELRKFRKLRNCSFMHNHEGTTAAITLLPPKIMRKKMRLERYLNKYIKC